MCIIGMQVKSVMPLIIMDALINVRLLPALQDKAYQKQFYLTLLFVVPLRSKKDNRLIRPDFADNNGRIVYI
jgi:hypothetical protein